VIWIRKNKKCVIRTFQEWRKILKANTKRYLKITVYAEKCKEEAAK
jgi:hypothetical protein